MHNQKHKSLYKRQPSNQHQSRHIQVPCNNTPSTPNSRELCLFKTKNQHQFSGSQQAAWYRVGKGISESNISE